MIAAASLVGDIDADVLEAADRLAAGGGIRSRGRVDGAEIVNAIARARRGGVDVLEEDRRTRAAVNETIVDDRVAGSDGIDRL